MRARACTKELVEECMNLNIPNLRDFYFLNNQRLRWLVLL